jgi:hypothetical protein
MSRVSCTPRTRTYLQPKLDVRGRFLRRHYEEKVLSLFFFLAILGATRGANDATAAGIPGCATEKNTGRLAGIVYPCGECALITNSRGY